MVISYNQWSYCFICALDIDLLLPYLELRRHKRPNLCSPRSLWPMIHMHVIICRQMKCSQSQALMMCLCTRCGSGEQGLPSGFDQILIFTAQVNKAVLFVLQPKLAWRQCWYSVCLREVDWETEQLEKTLISILPCSSRAMLNPQLPF